MPSSLPILLTIIMPLVALFELAAISESAPIGGGVQNQRCDYLAHFFPSHSNINNAKTSKLTTIEQEKTTKMAGESTKDDGDDKNNRREVGQFGEKEEERVATTSDKDANNGGEEFKEAICPPLAGSCCPPSLQRSLFQKSTGELERVLRSAHLQPLAHFLAQQRTAFFAGDFRLALRLSAHHVDWFFRRSYGRFYTQNAEVLVEFFDDLEQILSFSSSSSAPEQDIKNSIAGNSFSTTLDRMLTRLATIEFHLLNPLLEMGDRQKACIGALFSHSTDSAPSSSNNATGARGGWRLRTFGLAPRRILNIVGRSFAFWRALLTALNDAARSVQAIAEKATPLPPWCPGAFVRMHRCQVCSARTASAKPCPAFCVNVLRGCLAPLADIDPQWNELIVTLIRFAKHLRSVHNPYKALFSLPTLISDAVMHFQENGRTISNRIILECYMAVEVFQQQQNGSLTNAAEKNDKADGASESLIIRRRRKKRRTPIGEEEEIDELDGEESDEEPDDDEQISAESESEDSFTGDEEDDHRSRRDGKNALPDQLLFSPSSKNNATNFSIPSFSIPVSVFNHRRVFAEYAERFTDSVDDFIDKLLRLKRYFRQLPETICVQGELAEFSPWTSSSSLSNSDEEDPLDAEYGEEDGSNDVEEEDDEGESDDSGDEMCWNGTELAPYRRPRAGEGLWALREHRNAEFSEGLIALDGVSEQFRRERVSLLETRDALEELLEGAFSEPLSTRPLVNLTSAAVSGSNQKKRAREGEQSEDEEEEPDRRRRGRKKKIKPTNFSSSSLPSSSASSRAFQKYNLFLHTIFAVTFSLFYCFYFIIINV